MREKLEIDESVTWVPTGILVTGVVLMVLCAIAAGSVVLLLVLG